MTERAHAILSASSAHRWLNCTPSARLEEQFPDTESEDAKEGTHAHAGAELELLRWLGRITPEEFRERSVEWIGSRFVNADFLASLKTYVDFCKEKITSVREKTPDAVILLEERLDFSHLVPEGFGTGDLVIVADGVLEVIDLKFGKGIEVSAIENEQEMLYGLGAYEAHSLLYDINTVRLTIVQPRKQAEPSTWEIPVPDLLRWGDEYVRPLAEMAWKGEGFFRAGDHCGFCRAKASCRERSETNLALVQYEFKAPELLSAPEITAILGKATQLKKWAGDVQDYALEKAKTGYKFAGFKLVSGRSNRKYSDPDAVAKALIDAGIPEAVIYERSLLGVTALEKAITKKRFEELLKGLITKPPGAPTLVPVTDGRPEIEASAIEGFEDVTT